MTPYDIVRAACVKANPKIREHFNRCMACGYGFTYCRCKPKRTEYYEDRPIRLADVLLAIGGKPPIHIGASDGGFAYFIQNFDESLLGQWHLRNDDLSQQSAETLKFLADLLRV